MEKLPLHAIVLLVGVTGSGKSHWCNLNVPSHQVLSLANLRRELCGSDRNFTQDHVVWAEIYRRARRIVEMGQRVVIDAPNLKVEDRTPFISMGSELGTPVYLLFFNTLKAECAARLGVKDSYQLNKQCTLLDYNIKSIRNSGRDHVRFLEMPQEVHVVKGYENQTRILAVGDVHGDYEAMTQAVAYAQSNGLFLVWLGDIVDYGPANLRCVKLAHSTVSSGVAHMIWGNHERKIDRWIEQGFGSTFRGKLSDANQATVREIQSLNPERRARFHAAWRSLASQATQHARFGDWIFTHGAVHPDLWSQHQGAHRLPGEAGNMAYFGEVDQHTPNRDDGYPNRVWNWVDSVPQGHFAVVGHDYLDRDTFQPVIKTNSNGGQVICLDTGSGKEGRLSGAVIDLQKNSFEFLNFTP